MTFVFNDKNFHLRTFVLAVLPAGRVLSQICAELAASLHHVLSSNITFSETKYPCPPT